MNTKFPVTFRQLDASTLLVQWPAVISRDVLDDLLRVKHALEEHPLQGMVEIFTSYHCLAIGYDSAVVSSKQLILHLEKLELGNNPFPKTHWIVPVCYDPALAPDLEAFCSAKQLEWSQVVSLHSSASYTVFFLGFLPGFLYLGGLNELLHLPRKANPDRKIKQGSVAIGGQQTGIYPQDSPGGWHVIGHCPVPLFRPELFPPVAIAPGDEVTFDPVDRATLQDIHEQVQAGTFQLQTQNARG